jgi:putative transposase
MSRSRYKFYESQYPYFVTCTVVGWLPVFTRPETFQIVLDSLVFLQREERITLFGYVILENHLHMIFSSRDPSKELGDFKSFTARQIIDYLEARKVELFLNQMKFFKENHKTDREYQFWQEGSHPQQLKNGEMMLQKLEYIHLNPVKRGFVDEAVHWRLSSARNYAGLPGLIPVQTDWVF